VTNVGHSHPKIVSAISEQAGLLLHTSNLYSIDWQQQLAQKLTRLAGMERAFFNNSGAEANETALKMARLWLAQRHRAAVVVVMENAFHGRTWAPCPPAMGRRCAWVSASCRGFRQGAVR
jgi:acetylornithine aminotransferase